MKHDWKHKKGTHGTWKESPFQNLTAVKEKSGRGIVLTNVMRRRWIITSSFELKTQQQEVSAVSVCTFKKIPRKGFWPGAFYLPSGWCQCNLCIFALITPLHNRAWPILLTFQILMSDSKNTTSSEICISKLVCPEWILYQGFVTRLSFALSSLGVRFWSWHCFIHNFGWSAFRIVWVDHFGWSHRSNSPPLTLLIIAYFILSLLHWPWVVLLDFRRCWLSHWLLNLVLDQEWLLNLFLDSFKLGLNRLLWLIHPSILGQLHHKKVK